MTYLPVSSAPTKGQKCVVADVAATRLGRVVKGDVNVCDGMDGICFSREMLLFYTKGVNVGSL